MILKKKALGELRRWQRNVGDHGCCGYFLLKKGPREGHKVGECDYRRHLRVGHVKAERNSMRIKKEIGGIIQKVWGQKACLF